MNLRRLRLFCWLIVAAAIPVVAAVAGYQTFGADRSPVHNVLQLGGPFTMKDQNGRTVTEATYVGRPQAIFFGFTHCPDVCPTTLMEASQWLTELGPAADRLQTIFVTVDPERDTVKVLREYLSAFDPRIVGLTGSPDELARMANEYGAFFRKAPAEDGNYTMEHTASMLLFDAKGQFRSTIDFHEGREPAMAKLRNLLNTST